MTFNLVDEKWVHVVSAGGGTSVVGLRELFRRAHEFERIQFSTAVETGSVLRLLEALTYRITGLDADVAYPVWQANRNELFTKPGFDVAAVDAYFDDWFERFDLFDEARPFAQDPRLPEDGVTRTTVGKVVYDIPAGNNVTWFGPYPPDSVPAGEAVSWLLASLCFGAGGRMGARKKVAVGIQGIARGAVSVHFVGMDLYQTLLANLAPPTGPSEPFPWEAEVLPAAVAGASLTGLIDTPNRTLGRWVNALLLDHDGRVVTGVWNSWAYSNVTEVDDPHLVYSDFAETKTRTVRRVKRADPSRALWRDSVALVQNPAASPLSGQPSGVEVVRASEGVSDEVAATLSVVGYSNNTDKSKELGAWESSSAGVGPWLLSNPDRYWRAVDVLTLIEKQGWCLRSALRQVAKELGVEASTLVVGAETGYFAKAETVFAAEISEELPPAAGNAQLGGGLRQAALAEFDRLTERLLTTAMHCAAVAAARSVVTSANRPKKEKS